jgi:cold shock CspA family protein
VVSGERPQDHAHEDAYVAVRDAFDAVMRQLEDHVRKLDGRVKTHEEPLRGRVARFVAEEGYGFVETGDGREVYFHRNSVSGGNFAELRIGDEVRLVVDEGEKGPQASMVQRIGKPHVIS